MVTRLKIEPTKALSFCYAKFTRDIMKTINVKFINRKEKNYYVSRKNKSINYRGK